MRTSFGASATVTNLFDPCEEKWCFCSNFCSAGARMGCLARLQQNSSRGSARLLRGRGCPVGSNSAKQSFRSWVIPIDFVRKPGPGLKGRGSKTTKTNSIDASCPVHKTLPPRRSPLASLAARRLPLLYNTTIVLSLNAGVLDARRSFCFYDCHDPKLRTIMFD
jgi:hypothetical protein